MWSRAPARWRRAPVRSRRSSRPAWSSSRTGWMPRPSRRRPHVTILVPTSRRWAGPSARRASTSCSRASRIPARNAAVDLLIAGDGPERAALLAARDRLGLAERVQLLGTLDRDGVAALYRGALFAVCPSRWEGLPVACLEAMASSRAVVASAVDGIPDAVLPGNTGILVPAEDAGAL